MAKNATNTFSQAIHANRKKIGDMTFHGELLKDAKKREQVSSAITEILETGTSASLKNMGVKPYYHRKGKQLTLRVRNPNSPKISQPWVTIDIKDPKIIHDGFVMKLMQSFQKDSNDKRAKPIQRKITIT